MSLQQEISKENLKEKINKKFLSLIEGITPDNKYYIARTYMDVPDMDGVVFIKNTKKEKIGDFVNVRVTGVREYDLIGELIE